MASACTAVGSAKRFAAALATRASSPRAAKSMPRGHCWRREGLQRGSEAGLSPGLFARFAAPFPRTMADLASLSEHARGLHGVPAQYVPCLTRRGPATLHCFRASPPPASVPPPAPLTCQTSRTWWHVPRVLSHDTH